MSAIERVVVTGGLGLLGRYVVSALSAKYTVTVADIGVSEDTDTAKHADIRNLDRLKEVFQGQDTIVHLAGLDSVIDAKPQEFIEVNTFGTWCVFEAAAACGINNIVNCSSAGAYGLDHNCPPGLVEKLPIDETQRPLAHTAYRLSKLFGETIAESFALRNAMSVCSLRLSAVIYPETVHELVSLLEEDTKTWLQMPAALPGDVSLAASANVPLYRSYVEAGDAARAILCALENPVAGHRVFNINASDTLVPYRTLDFVANIAAGQMPPYDATHYQANPRAAVFSNEKALREIGWRPEKTWAEISKAHFQA